MLMNDKSYQPLSKMQLMLAWNRVLLGHIERFRVDFSERNVK